MFNSIPSYRRYNYSPYSFHIFIFVSYFGDSVSVTVTLVPHTTVGNQSVSREGHVPCRSDVSDRTRMCVPITQQYA
jgi:hypothetical protein